MTDKENSRIQHQIQNWIENICDDAAEAVVEHFESHGIKLDNRDEMIEEIKVFLISKFESENNREVSNAPT